MGRLARTLLVVGTLVIAAGVSLAAYTYVSHTNHQDACQRYGEALSVVLANPQEKPVDQTSMTALSSVDRQTVTAARLVFQRTVSPPPDPTLDPESVVAAGQAASRIPTASQIMPQWTSWADQFKRTALVAQGC